jgi:hypothetical protein
MDFRTTAIDEQYYCYTTRVVVISDTAWEAMLELWAMIDSEIRVRASITDDQKN